MSKPTPLAICIEDLDALSDEERYLQCVAVVGRQPGLRLDGDGAVTWLVEEETGGELWVSLDQRLILYRPEGAGPLRVSRDGRSLDVPVGRPVVLIDQDEIEAGGRHLRIHVHGEAPAVVAPRPYVFPALEAEEEERASTGERLVRAAATALAIGAAMGAAGCKKEVEVREAPPSMERVPDPKQQQQKQAPAPDQAVKAPDAAPAKPDLAPAKAEADEAKQLEASQAAAKKAEAKAKAAAEKARKARILKLFNKKIEVRMKPPGAPARGLELGDIKPIGSESEPKPEPKPKK